MPDRVLNSRKIISLRERKGWAQRALADATKCVDPERTGVNVKTVQNAESGKLASPRTQALLAAALGVRSEQLEPWYELRLIAPFVVVGVVACAAALSIFQRAPSDTPTLRPSTGVRPGLTSDVDYRTAPSIAITAIQVSDERFGYSLTIHGHDFGSLPYALPYFGDTAFLRISDPTHHFEAGYLDDKFAVRYLQWSNETIRVADIVMRAPGDDIEVGVWNPQSGRGAAWAGNVPPVVEGTPRIGSLSFAGTGSEIRIRVVGTNFGTLPPTSTDAPVSGNIVVADLRYHDFVYHPGVRSIALTAGNAGGAPIRLYSWHNNEIDVGIPTKRPDEPTWSLHPGDPVLITVMRPATNLVTTWGGSIPPALFENAGWSTLYNQPTISIE